MEADEGEQDDRGAYAGVQSGVFKLLVRHDLSGVWKHELSSCCPLLLHLDLVLVLCFLGFIIFIQPYC